MPNEPTWRRFTLVDAFVMLTTGAVSAALVGGNVRDLLGALPGPYVALLYGWSALALFQVSWFAAPIVLCLQFETRGRDAKLTWGEFCWLLQSGGVIAMWGFAPLSAQLQTVGPLGACVGVSAFLICVVRGFVLLVAMGLRRYRPSSWTDFLGVMTTSLSGPALLVFIELSSTELP